MGILSGNSNNGGTIKQSNVAQEQHRPGVKGVDPFTPEQRKRAGETRKRNNLAKEAAARGLIMVQQPQAMAAPILASVMAQAPQAKVFAEGASGKKAAAKKDRYPIASFPTWVYHTSDTHAKFKVRGAKPEATLPLTALFGAITLSNPQSFIAKLSGAYTKPITMFDDTDGKVIVLTHRPSGVLMVLVLSGNTLHILSDLKKADIPARVFGEISTDLDMALTAAAK